MSGTRGRQDPEHALRESEDRYAKLIEEAPDPIVTLDLVGRVQLVNPAVEQAVGYAARELIGQHFATLGIVSPASLPRAIEEFAFAIAGMRRQPFEIEAVHKKGVHLVFEANPCPFEREGSIAGVHVIFRDVTRRKRAEERLHQLEREVNELLARLGEPPKYAA